MTIESWKAWLSNSKGMQNSTDSHIRTKPLWTVDLDDDVKIIEWHVKISNDTEDIQNARVASYSRTKDLYCGHHQNSHGRLGPNQDPLSGWGSAKFKMPEVVVNHSYELTEQWVAKLSRFSTNVDVLPVNSDEGDRNKARASQRYANYLSELHDFKGMFLDFIRDSKIGGESYIVVDYDPNAGDLHPDQKRADKEGVRVPLKDAQGKAVVGEDGTQLYIDKKQRVGDLCYRKRSVPEILLHPKRRWSDVEWFREVDLVDFDDLKRLYPDKINELLTKRNQNTQGSQKDEPEAVFVYTYWHKHTEALDSGRKIVMTNEVVLENIPHPFSGAPLNIVRLTDIDIEGELHGRSFLDNIITLQLILNKCYTLWYQNIALGSHLYWLVPANARVARDKIRNSSSVIQYHGNVKPEIAVFRTVSSDLLQLIDKIEARMLTISRIQTTSRGELPPNVEAGVAIGMLEEQEAQAATPDVKKVTACIEKIFKLSLGVAGDKFDKTDGRTARVLGKEGEFLLEELDTAKLSGPYDIKVKKATALSQSKPLMLQQITQLEAMRPGFLKEEELYDLLELGDRDKFYDMATAARRLAEYENEQMQEGNEVPEPVEGEFHLVHWQAHMMKLQTPGFKVKASKESADMLRTHILTTEYMLFEAAKKNIKLATQLAEESYFPAFYQSDFTIAQVILALQNGDNIPALGERDDTEDAMIDPMAMSPEAGMMPPVPDGTMSEEAGPDMMADDMNGADPTMQGESVLNR